MRDHKVFEKKANEEKKAAEKKKLDWIEYGTTRASKHAKRIMKDSQTLAREQELEDIRTRHEMNQKVNAQKRMFKNEDRAEKRDHLKKIQKTATDIAKAVDGLEAKKKALRDVAAEEQDKFYEDERAARLLEDKLKLEALNKPKKTKEQEKEDKEMESLKDLLPTLAQQKSKAKYTDFSADDVVPMDETAKHDTELEKQIADQMEDIFQGKDEGKLIHDDQFYKKHREADDIRDNGIAAFTNKAQKAIEEAEELEKEFEQLEKSHEPHSHKKEKAKKHHHKKHAKSDEEDDE